MKTKHFLLLAVLFTAFLNAQAISHEAWNALLKKHVSAEGKVNYKGFKADRTKLNAYLKTLEATTPSGSWSKQEAMAFWINAYNAFTVALILDHYPVKSINEIQQNGKKPWDIAFIKIGGKSYTLNHIEHEILRKRYADPRIHFAVNCASFSCPPLLNEAFTADNLNAKMEALAKAFVNDPLRNKITAQKVEVSQIFNWFKDDFTKNGTLIDFLNKYSKTKISSSAKVSFLPYNWSLNE
jgi:hypothetical protein